MGKRPDLFDQLDAEENGPEERAGETADQSPEKENKEVVESLGEEEIMIGEGETGTYRVPAELVPEPPKAKPTRAKRADRNIISVSADQEETPTIEIGDQGDDDLLVKKNLERKATGTQVVKELSAKKKPTGQAIVLVRPDGGVPRMGKKRKKKKKIKMAHIMVGAALAGVLFVFFLPKAAPVATAPAPVVEKPAERQSRIPTDASGQPLMLSGVPTPENGNRPVQIMAYLDIKDPECVSCMMPLAVLRSWWVQDSSRRALRVVVVGQDEATKKKLAALGITSWPALVLRGPNGVRTLSGEGALQDVFDSTRVVDSLSIRRMGPAAAPAQ